jgi:membrane protease YdiL (CAAX protease family)
MMSLSNGKHWVSLAVVTSVMFGLVHGYYVVTYGAASVIPFISLVTFGIAMALTYYWSKGNILIPAVLHGLYDATGFLGIATTVNIGLAARSILIFIGVVFAHILRKKILLNPKNMPPQPTHNPYPHQPTFIGI